MKRCIRPAFAATLLIPALTLLPGCDREADCGPALEAAANAGGQGLTLDSWIGTQPPHCREQASAMWEDRLAAECAPLHAFHAGRHDREMSGQCDDIELESAWNLGQMIGELEREQATIEATLRDQSLAPERRRELRQRRIVIERDLPQLQALARFDGLLAPVSVPDAPAEQD